MIKASKTKLKVRSRIATILKLATPWQFLRRIWLINLCRLGCELSSHECRHRLAKMTDLRTSAAHPIVHKFMPFTCLQFLHIRGACYYWTISTNDMPSPHDVTRPRYSSSATDDPQSNPDFPPIRIGTDVPLLSIPPGQLLNRNRYDPDKIREASNSSAVRSGAILRTSNALNSQPSTLSPSPSKKVCLRSLSWS